MSEETKDDGGPFHGSVEFLQKGISVRMWLAGMAMQGFISNSFRMKTLPAGTDEDFYASTTQASLEIADAMIAAGKAKA